jgi:Zn-finger nucleic acid-binding protein
MKCPKDKDCQLEPIHNLDQSKPDTSDCKNCGGQWISPDSYKIWQKNSLAQTDVPELVEPIFLAEDQTDYVPSDLDVKAGLCPECGSYLTRLRVFFTLKRSFYLERCGGCGGFWCDQGEWEILAKLNCTNQLPNLFSSKWQTQLRDRQKVELERQMVIEKLGAGLAQQLFDLITALETNNEAGFAANYLTRQLEKKQQT